MKVPRPDFSKSRLRRPLRNVQRGTSRYPQCGTFPGVAFNGENNTTTGAPASTGGFYA